MLETTSANMGRRDGIEYTRVFLQFCYLLKAWQRYGDQDAGPLSE